MSENSEHMEKIQQIIMDLSGEAAFSGEAMKQFLQLKDEVDSLSNTCDYLRRERNERDDQIKKLREEMRQIESNLDAASDEVQHWRKKSLELAGRESQIAILEARVNHAEQRVEDHQNMVGLVFRNAEVRKTTLGQELHYQPGNPEMRDQYGNVQTYHEPPGLVPTDVKKDETETQT